jgi:hypothetical protein
MHHGCFETAGIRRLHEPKPEPQFEAGEAWNTSGRAADHMREHPSTSGISALQNVKIISAHGMKRGGAAIP